MTAELQNPEPAGVVIPASHDAQLIVRILAGERELFHELVRPYERRVYRVTLPILHNEQEAEDAAQETMLKALKNLHTFRAESRFSTWLISIAVNEARVRLRHGRGLRFESVDPAAEGEGGSFTAAMMIDRREIPLQALERKELGQMLQEAIAALPAIYREVLLLRDVEELSIAETAAMLGLSKGLVRTRLLRARLRMQKILYPQLQHGQNGGSKHKRINRPAPIVAKQSGREAGSKRLSFHSYRQGFSSSANHGATG